MTYYEQVTYYEYAHLAGYGREDHLADEVIARAARALGLDGADAYIAEAVGLASHAVGNRALVRMPAGPGVRLRMERALRTARTEIRADCRIVVRCLREVRERADGERDVHVIIERRSGTAWVPHDDRWEELDDASWARIARRELGS